ncbi:MAG: hypothetical protein NVSMB23_14830 [Myxococcales bacterium]
MSENQATTPHPAGRAHALAAARVPAWAYLFALPCAALALAGIDLGAHDPVGDPVAEGLKQMVAVATCAGAAFAAALLGRARRPLALRIAGCAALGAAGALAFACAAPRRTGAAWKRFDGGAWSAELPAAPALSRRNAPTDEGEMPPIEAVATLRGAVFRVQESEPPRAARADPATLLSRARREALGSGRERVVEERPLDPAAPAGAPRGLDLRFRLDGHDFRARIWAAPPRVLVLTVGPLDEVGPEADRFLGSLQLQTRR